MAVTAIKTGLTEDEIEPLSDETTQKLYWLDSKINEVLEAAQGVPCRLDLVPQDGQALMELLCRPVQIENIQEK